MQKAIELVKKISKDLEKNWLPELEEINFHLIFRPVYSLPNNIITLNTITCFIIWAYDNDSQRIDIKQDRLQNKIDILEGLGANVNEEIYQSVLNLETDDMQEVVWQYLKRQPDWRFKTIITCFDYHSKHIRSATEPISELITDDLEIAKINKAKGELLKEAIRQREVGEQLLIDIKKNFVKLDEVTQSEFGFTSTDIEKIDIMSWKQFIERKNKNKLNA